MTQQLNDNHHINNTNNNNTNTNNNKDNSIINNSSSFIEVEELECGIPNIPHCNDTQRRPYFPSQPLPAITPLNIPDTETLFETQKMKIKSTQIKNEIQSHKPKQTPTTIFNGVIIPNLSLNDTLFWEISKFETEISSNCIETTPIPSPVWTCNLTYLQRIYKQQEHLINITNYAMRTINEVNYLNQCIELSLSFALQGESYLWIFTRCFINKDNNESCMFDNDSKFTSKNQAFNKYTPVIIVMKEDKMNKCTIEFGTFYELPDSPNPCYKTFLKRQLIDYSSKEKRLSLLETDVYYFNMIIYDYGNEKLWTKIMVNNSGKYNDISASFFIPCNKRGKIMLAGNGQSVEMYKVLINTKDKGDIKQEIYFSMNRQTCSCCSLF